LPGVEDPSEVRKRVGKTAKLTFHAVDQDMPSIPEDKDKKQKPVSSRAGVEYLLDEDARHSEYIPIIKKVILTGDLLTDARVEFDPTNGAPAVSLRFNKIGAKKFAQASKDLLNKRFAMVLDDKVISAPVFSSVIPGGEGRITSPNFTVKSAEELALILRAGALPAPLKVVDEKTIGPSLGADSIQDGKRAVFIAFVLVAVFMTLSYGMFGMFANIALIFNIIFLFAGLSMLQATLTLPGIAGIALTIGMAVDANVLIYERIKEEIRAGLKPVSAIEAGYKRARMTIIDSNLTTLFGAGVLFEFGSGPIRGFAVTLALGIVISLFTALSLSRLIIVAWLKRRKVEVLPI
jgi:preprotein translocase subunit SecD